MYVCFNHNLQIVNPSLKNNNTSLSIGLQLNEQAPKQPVSSYLRFCKEKREKIKKKHSDFGFVELNAQLSAKWTALGPIGQAPYKKAYEDEYQQYKKDLLSYYDTHSDLVPPPKVEKLLKKIRYVSVH